MLAVPADPIPLSNMDAPPSQNQVAKGLEVLKIARREGKLDSKSFAWLKAALDPWHDTNIVDLDGMPDLAVGKSISFSSVQELEFSKPLSFGAGNWGLHIANYPTLTVNGLTTYNPTTTASSDTWRFQGNTPTQETIAGPVVVQLIANGFNPIYPSPTGNPAVWQTGAIYPNPEHIDGNVRCIGMAIETLNTTSPLYVQGLCTITRFNQGDSLSSCSEVWNFAETTQHGVHEIQWAKAAPNLLSQQTLNSVISQWHAKEGSYSVINMKVTEDFSQKSAPGALGVYSEEFTPGAISGPFNALVQAANIPNGQVSGPMLYQSIGASQGVIHNIRSLRSTLKRFPCDGVAINYTGLSDQTTITVRVRWILERFPNEGQPQVVVFAKPCSRYSPFALELYRQIAQELPPAVMYKENPAGEWWKRILGTIGKVGGPLLSFIPGVGGMASSLVNAGSQMLLDSAEADKKERKKFNKANPSKAINSKGKKKKKKQTLTALPPGWENKAYNAQVRLNGPIKK